MPGDRSISVVIVGAGIGGIAAAIELRRHGFDDVTATWTNTSAASACSTRTSSSSRRRWRLHSKDDD
jgi:glycine/D-amino acid oxidase-like deaminating enzyme